MFTTRRRFTVGFAAIGLLVLGSVGVGTAQQPRGPAAREVRGAVKSVDAKKGSITVTTAEGQAAGEKTFTLAKDAEIALGDGTGRRLPLKAGKLEDLAAGSIVSLTLSEDGKSATAVLAQGPQLRGTLTKVDAAKRQLVVSLFAPGRDPAAEEKTFKLAADAEIGVDDGRGRRFSVREGKLDDLKAGAPAMLQLSADQQEVLAVTAEGQSLSGTVRAVDDKQLTIGLPPQRGGEEPEERKLDVADDAVVLLDDGRGRRLSLTAGKLSDVPVGAFVRIRLSGDQNLAVQIAAEGPSQGGVVKSVDPEKRTITVATFGRDGAAEKSLTVAEDARIIVDNAPAKLDDVKPAENGPFANLRLSLDQQTVQVITIFTQR